ncbi:MAG: DUF2169 domain-containing protein [Desulfovibrionaceae bacterium]
MKTYKDRQHSLMVKPFGFAGRQYCGVTVFVFFDLADPDSLLKEQELWEAVPGQLPKGASLDMGFPKARAEFVAFGSCFAPRGETRNASKASVRVGDAAKMLYVFGRRYWTPVGAITDPEPFREIPLVYANAYGGPEYELNPEGAGFKTSVALDTGEVRRNLPLVELPKQLIGSLTYHPEPASFAPLGVMLPQRQKKAGTFDEAWFRTRWPNMPDDMDPLHFNTASPDQHVDGWFNGGEAIEIANMNPDEPVIQSRLPGKRIRAFFTLYKDYDRFKKPETFETEFREVSMHIDTVTLLPSIMRGVVHYRGLLENADDEYYDLARALVCTEASDEAPKDIEYYHEEQLRRLDRRPKMDLGRLEAGAKKLSKIALNVKKLPKEIERITQKALREAPFMPRSPEEMAGMAKDNLARSMAAVDKLEGVAKKLHAQFGHKAEIDLEQFDKMRGKLAKMGQRFEKAGQKTAKVEKDLTAMVQEMTAEAHDAASHIVSKENLAAFGLTPEQAKAAGVPVEGFALPVRSKTPFHEHGFPIVVEARKRLERDPESMARLRRLGFDRKTIKHAWLGVLPDPLDQKQSLWGVEDVSPDKDPFIIPAGLVMPRFDKDALNRFMVRPGPLDKLADPGAEETVPASDETPLALFPAAEQAHWIRTADELQALYAEQETGDCCGVVSLPDPGAKPDKDAAKEIEEAGVFLIVMPAGATASDPEFLAWKEAFPNAKLLALPEGETVFQAALAGHGLRDLVLDALPKEFAEEHSVDFQVPKEPGGKVGIPELKFPEIDYEAKIKGAMAKAKARHEPMIKELTGKHEKAMADLDGKLKDSVAGGSLEQAAAEDGGSAKDLAKQINDYVANRKKFFESKGFLTPEKASDMDKAMAGFEAGAGKLDALEAEGEAQLAGLGKKMEMLREMADANRIPGMSPEEMQAAGLDPDKGEALTRSQVIELLERGESLAERDFTGADLSRLDLSNADLRKALLVNTNLAKAKLDNARLDMSIVQECDLSKASLKGAGLRMCAVDKCNLSKASLQGASLDKVSFKRCNLTKADLSGASVQLTALSGCDFTKADFGGANVHLAIFGKSEFKQASLRKAKMSKALIKDSRLDRADFGEACVNRVMIKGSKGRSVSFAGADMTSARMAGDNELPGADFRNARLDWACLRGSDLSGADFRGATLHNALVELCDLSNAKLRLTKAKRARLLKTNLEHADLAGMDLLMGSLRKSRLVCTDLTGANLYSVDFYKTVMHDTILDKANLKRTFLHHREEYLP